MCILVFLRSLIFRPRFHMSIRKLNLSVSMKAQIAAQQLRIDELQVICVSVGEAILGEMLWLKIGCLCFSNCWFSFIGLLKTAQVYLILSFLIIIACQPSLCMAGTGETNS